MGSFRSRLTRLGARLLLSEGNSRSCRRRKQAWGWALPKRRPFFRTQSSPRLLREFQRLEFRCWVPASGVPVLAAAGKAELSTAIADWGSAHRRHHVGLGREVHAGGDARRKDSVPLLGSAVSPDQGRCSVADRVKPVARGWGSPCKCVLRKIPSLSSSGWPRGLPSGSRRKLPFQILGLGSSGRRPLPSPPPPSRGAFCVGGPKLTLDCRIFSDRPCKLASSSPIGGRSCRCGCCWREPGGRAAGMAQASLQSGERDWLPNNSAVQFVARTWARTCVRQILMLIFFLFFFFLFFFSPPSRTPDLVYFFAVFSREDLNAALQKGRWQRVAPAEMHWSRKKNISVFFLAGPVVLPLLHARGLNISEKKIELCNQKPSLFWNASIRKCFYGPDLLLLQRTCHLDGIHSKSDFRVRKIFFTRFRQKNPAYPEHL